jgi:hypothetical protein
VKTTPLACLFIPCLTLLQEGEQSRNRGWFLDATSWLASANPVAVVEDALPVAPDEIKVWRVSLMLLCL